VLDQRALLAIVAALVVLLSVVAWAGIGFVEVLSILGPTTRPADQRE
jgi:hypothetical protein